MHSYFLSISAFTPVCVELEGMDDDLIIPTGGITPSSSSNGAGPDDVRPSTGTPWRSAPDDLRPNVTIIVSEDKDIDLGSVSLPESDNVEYYEIYIQGADDDAPIPFDPSNPIPGIPQVSLEFHLSSLFLPYLSVYIIHSTFRSWDVHAHGIDLLRF